METLELPKGELHLHLNGAIPTELLKKMILDSGLTLPECFDLEKDLNVLEPRENLSEYLKPWMVLNKIPLTKECLIIQILSAVELLKNNNIKFAELRNTVFYIAELNNLDLETALLWLLEGISIAEQRTGVILGLIITLNRKDLSVDKCLSVLSAVKNLNYPDKIIGLDLAGNEEIPVSNDIGFFFQRVKGETNLGITIHAGETGIVSNIYQAIDVFCADRIGHANATIKDVKLMEILSKKDIVIEVCPISNQLTGAVRNENYSFMKFIEYDVPFVLCSDNPAIHRRSIDDDYKFFLEKTGRSDILSNMYNMQKKYSFIR